MNTYQQETIEFQPVTITVDGQPATATQLAVAQHWDRPTTWTDPVTLNGKQGLMIQGLGPGLYNVWAKVTANPETPVIKCGQFQVE